MNEESSLVQSKKEQIQPINDLRKTLQLNCAASHVKLEDWEKSINVCSEVFFFSK